MSKPLFNPWEDNEWDGSPITNPIPGMNDDLNPDLVTQLPTGAVIGLQVIFYVLLAFLMLYLISHWIFHTWSFANIFKMGLEKRAKPRASISDHLMPFLTVLMFLLYTAYMGGFVFVTIAMLQFEKYFKGFIKVLPDQKIRNMIGILLWVFFSFAIFPVVVNMIAALIKIARDYYYSKRMRREFEERKREYQEQLGRAGAQVSPEEPMPGTALATGGRTKGELPLVFVYVPVYNEPLPNLLGAINGITQSDYPRLRLMIGFDNYNVQETFFTLCRLMTGVPLRTETLARNHPPEEWIPSTPGTPIPSVIAESMDSDLIPMDKAMGRKAQKYNGFDQLVSGGASPMNSPAPSPRTMALPSAPLDPSPCLSAMGTSSASAIGLVGRSSMDFDSDNCPDEHSLFYRGIPVTVLRFEHSGKLGTQRKMFERMREMIDEEGMTEEPYVLFMDSDTAIMQDTVSQMVAELQRYPQSKACTGFVVSRNEDSYNFWRILQDAEYIESMIFRNAESQMGAVTCLPGVLTMFKLPVLIDVSAEYFYQSAITSTYDFCRRYLGEDRYLTHILMEKPGTYTLGFNSKAICKTEAPSNFSNLLRQRRRWFLGTITNEMIMLCTPLFWAKYPLLMLTKFFQVLKVGGAVTYLLLVEVAFNLIFDYKTFNWGYVLWLSVIIVPNWLFVTFWAIFEKRLKAVFIFPFYYWFNPFFMIAILMYSFLTVRQRTWGGPRAAAAGGNKAEGTDDGGSSSADDEMHMRGGEIAMAAEGDVEPGLPPIARYPLHGRRRQ